ncbi:MAG TPA: tRNA (adenosine(37)-N6)-threonylcarbamoyltransferase complex ATPase subunit type 1 TsaE [Cyclobacteriaceae bacterium]|jgi:tRNA threonylcarbamoyladenosine biosynthesis protein TsaE|nr:tRNA (adenosine(37)-N6)-threonylcarbamoyltransferase complex ATPase subunit type 1 TsaE [Cytophagales bacterium]HNT49644.1 tRNA (adenosine(37)-N6)-threonylcarbamoyltransferase complex ATPase subunit type 1 TsaE [Cyclobacteriaceae bacterium]HRE66729.1 tRNA (adenosine(37)-N6)-threonylcarbamoyltransferase complex ATPase subunit type 1 TsaE [Cyclobacteriaceae bacterium]HRF33543.1 tRNA (adenosine(37)-N6)-threonylcarbamoyltransferase complex ATPase subunit type 1 TsaE [Cyclobacteriaceae bacterium]
MPDDWKKCSKPVTLSSLPETADELLKAGAAFTVWTLQGEMGSGKTTLVKSIVKQLGLTDLVTSPTFSIVNEYGRAENQVYHFDFYRLKRDTEALDLGFEEYLASGHLCLIEWAEKVITFLPSQRFEVRIDTVNENTREIYFRVQP